MTGIVSSNTIFIDTTLEYNTNNFKPKINDYMVMSIKRIKDNNYKIAWGAFQASLNNASNITLLKESSNSLNADLAAIEWFINTNGEESDFFFDGDRAYINRPNGDTIQIYPKLTQKDDPSISSYSGERQKTLIVFLVAFCFVATAIIYTKFLKNKK